MQPEVLAAGLSVTGVSLATFPCVSRRLRGRAERFLLLPLVGITVLFLPWAARVVMGQAGSFPFVVVYTAPVAVCALYVAVGVVGGVRLRESP